MIKTCLAFDSSHERYWAFAFWGGEYPVKTLVNTFVWYVAYECDIELTNCLE